MDKKAFFDFLDTRKTAVMAEAKALADDDRKDESNILKAKANIYDIFKAMYGACERDGAVTKDSLCAVAERIYSPWEKSLAAAQEHGDTAKVLIEEAKLSAVKEVIDWL